ncbi:MAG: hypothetical protein KGM24_02175, partial [Elusimicrobia bacterium]|nr:hypothetical protein [Elusimicrobiota bacterium]
QGTVRTSQFHLAPWQVLEDGSSPVVLDADPSSPAAVEKALRALVDQNPGKYGAASGQMAKVSVNVLPAVQPGQAPSILAVFRQWAQGVDVDGSPYYLLVDGASLAFHIKVFDGKPVVMGSEGRLAPGVDPAIMKPGYTDDELLALAAKRLQSPPDAAPGSDQARGPSGLLDRLLGVVGMARRRRAPGGNPSLPPPTFLSRVITNQLDGTFRAINLYQAQDLRGQPLIVAVDVHDGKAFAFSAQDLRTHLISDLKAVSGVAVGRGTTMTPSGDDNGPIGPIALPLTNVYDENGKVVAVTDEQGRFTIPDDGRGTPRKLTIKLESPFVPFVKDEDAAKTGAPVQVTVTAVPGQALTAALNPVSADPELAANIVGYVGYLQHQIWLKGLPGMNDPRMDSPLAGGVRVNGHDQPGNAYYNPANDSVNYMAAAVLTVRGPNGQPVKLSVENTAKQSIDYHEVTHRRVQRFSQLDLTDAQTASPAYRFVKWTMNTIMGSDVNESIADFVSDSMRDNPIIGQDFFINPPAGRPTYIRDARDKTPYDPQNPDPHNGVAVQSMWALRESGFVASLGDAAGKAYANAMIPLIIIGQPLNPVSLLLHLILWDMRADGRSPFADLIRRIASQDHGIDLPAVPAAPNVRPNS